MHTIYTRLDGWQELRDNTQLDVASNQFTKG
jgi:hypothetical protein